MQFRLTQRHIVAVNFLLIAAIAYLAARAVTRFIAQDLAAVPTAIQVPGSVQNEGIHPRAYYNVIVKRDVFNLVPLPSDQIATAVDLHLKLLGTSNVTGIGPYAIIEDQRGEQSLYRLGDDIPDAGRLVEVQESRAIIQHGAHRVALEIPEDTMPGGVQGPPALRGLKRFGMFQSNAKAADSPMPDINVDDEGPNRYGVKRSDIRVALQHSSALATQIKATPNMEGSEQNGYQLSEIDPDSVFDDLGLQDGDVITEVNGRPLNNPAEAAGMIATMQMRPSIDLMIMRNGAPVDLHYDIR